MSNVALFDGGKVPAFAKQREGKSALSQALAGDDFGKRISIKGGVFRLMSSGKEIASIEERYLDVVFVNAAPKTSRVWYAKPYDGEAQRADCWSADGETPSPDSKDKQSDRCMDCPKNIAGSGVNDSKACRFQHRIAVVLANNIEGDVLQIAIPGASIFGNGEKDNLPLKAYARWLAAQNIDPEMVVTRMKFDTSAESPKLFFKSMRWLEQEEYDVAVKQGKTPDALAAITFSVPKTDKVPAPIAIEGKKPVKAAPAPEPEEEDEEEAPPPPPKKAKAKAKVEAPAEEDDVEEPVVVKQEKKAPTIPSKASLASAIDAWDD
jgi:hypothetical protein